MMLKITMSKKTTMMTMMIVKVVLLLLLSIDLISYSSSAVVSTENNNNDVIDNYYRHDEQHGIDIFNQKQQGGVVDTIDDDDDDIINDMTITQEPRDVLLSSSSSSLLLERMMMKKQQIIKSKNHLSMNNGNNNNIMSTKQQQQQLNHDKNDQQKDITGSYVNNSHSIITTATNRLSLLDDEMIQNETKDFESIHRMMITNDTTTVTAARCVKNQKGIEIMIMKAPEYSLKPTNINICKDSIINIDGSTPNNITGFRGIHIINKFLNIRCDTKCFLNARGKSRHFYIQDSTIRFNNITFINGNEIKNSEKNFAYGGSLIINSSDIVINKCNFLNNEVNDDTNGGFAVGGAVACLDSNIVLFDVNMINNSATGTRFGYGGAFQSTTSNLKMANVLFINNKADYHGGAVYSEGDTLEMINVTCTNNSALDLYDSTGGCVYSYATNITLFNATMSNNTARYGGAIDVYGGFANITNSTLESNNAGHGGGAIFSWESTILLNYVVFKNNTAGFTGGAMTAFRGYVNITNSTFQSNNAGHNGGAFLSQNSTILLNSVVFKSNTAKYYGGAMEVVGGYVNITNSILQSNKARELGGAIGCYESTILLNSVVFDSNYAKNGTLVLVNSKAAGVKDAQYSKPITDVVDDVVIYNMQTELEWSSSKSNFPLSPPPRPSPNKQESIVAIAIQSSPGLKSSNKCVTTYLALRKQVHRCNNTMNMDPCVINICRAQIEMIHMVSGFNPMNLSNKNIVINCKLNNDKRCMIDGKGLSQIFYGSNVAVTFRNIIFSNGYSSISGGAFDLTESFVNLFNCSFMNNFAETGTAIMIKNTVFYMAGTESSFINNTGNSPALVGYSSELELDDTLFEGNKGTKYGNGLFVFNSTMTVYNTTFSESKKGTANDCNIFVAVDSNNFTNQATCLDKSSETD